MGGQLQIKCTFAKSIFQKMQKSDIRSVSSEEIKEFLISIHEKPFRSKQIHEWLWQKNVHSFDAMCNLSKSLIEHLKSHFSFHSTEIDQEAVSKDGTIKLIFRLFDGNLIEGVLIPSGKRVTACISSQVGCPLKCDFCATGTMGLTRNLHYWEIIDQYALMNKRSNEAYDVNISNFVFMGMGEPLLNYDQITKAINILTSPDGNGISPSRITLSTVGLVKGIRQLADDQFKANLAISIHVADDQKRNKLIPTNLSNPLVDLQNALKYYVKMTDQRITIEYVLMNQVNDSMEDAEKLCRFCKAFPVKINLIQYNATDSKYQKSTSENTKSFIDYLESKNLIVNLRQSRGQDIAAACGQLVKEKKIINLKK
jgi:23S rRNA (adenine2503-C2)-methyltransferase